MKNHLSALLSAFALVLSAGAQASLLGRDINGQAVAGSDASSVFLYDTDLNVTWLRDWNFAKTSGYDADGLMTWDSAIEWSSQLEYGGYSDWRLPKKYFPDSLNCVGFGCSGEMPHVWSEELGNPGGSLNVDQRNRGDFLNLYQLGSPERYWTAASAEWDATSAHDFEVLSGGNGIYSKTLLRGAVAVRDGDVLVVPEPGSLALFALGLVGVGWTRRGLSAVRFNSPTGEAQA